jgi:hypothetical protein
MRNYNTTGHKVFPRVSEIRIFYPANGIPHVRYVERIAVVDGDGRVQHTDASAVEREMRLDRLPEQVQCITPDTRTPIPGKFSTRQDLMLHLLAWINADQELFDADQERRDAEAQQARDDAAGTA